MKSPFGGFCVFEPAAYVHAACKDSKLSESLEIITALTRDEFEEIENQDRFWSTLKPMPNGCWEPVHRKTDPSRYVEVTTKWRAGQPYHRVAWELTYGLIPDGLVIDHLCRNRRCSNPDHLDAVTMAVNTQRGDRAILTERDVVLIRELYATGYYTQRTLAEWFRVNYTLISRIVRGERWLNVGGPIALRPDVNCKIAS